VDRGQPPLGSLAAWLLYQRIRERSLLAAHYDVLARNHHWWRAMRDPEGTGLISCGTSDVGEALYQGTHFGARNETGMDNSATHDQATYDPKTRSLSTWDLGLNCVVALDAEMLAKIAEALGKAEEAAAFAALAETHRRLIRTDLWDPEREIFANRQRHGGFVRALAPTSFYPLLCGAADAAQTAALLRHLDDPATFASPYPIPNATRDHPAYAENVYWRGRIWPNVNYLVWLGLHRAGQTARAARLAAESHALFRLSWQDRVAAENYNPETGAGLDQGDADPFYIWAALLPMMAAEEVCGFSPWEGWTLANGPDTRLGPILTPLGPASVSRTSGRLRLSAGGRLRLETDFPGRLAALRFEAQGFACTLSASDRPATLLLPGAEIVMGEIDGQPVVATEAGIALPAGAGARRLQLWLRRPELA
jgi:putative isomerase